MLGPWDAYLHMRNMANMNQIYSGQAEFGMYHDGGVRHAPWTDLPT